jgi:peptide/nickel transport system permease protein
MTVLEPAVNQPSLDTPGRAWSRPSGLAIWVALTVLILGVLITAPGLVSNHGPFGLKVSDRLNGPSADHWFGTDDFGRDIFSRVMHGTRYSIGSALTVAIFGVVVGTIYGATAAWVGGVVDRLMMRTVDVFLAFPYLVFAMAVAASLGRGLKSTIIALALLWWPSYARMVRGMVKSILNDYHVQAARTLGTNERQLLQWHVIPHTYDQILVRFTFDIGISLIALTGLSFLGLGVGPPTPEWGRMVADSKQLALSAPWYAIFPGLVIFLVVLNFVLLGEALRKRAVR